MTKLLKVSTVLLLGGVLMLSACGNKKTDEPRPDSVIATVPTEAPTSTPTPIPAVEESYEESMPEDNGDDMDSEVNDGWVQDDGDDIRSEEGYDEEPEIGIVEDTEDTDQGAEGNQAVALEIADVYSEPGGDPDTIIGSIDANERVTVQGNVDGWFVISYNGTRAYVNSELFG